RVPEGWIELMAESGLRVVAAPSFRDASWRVVGGSRVEWVWAPEEGERQLEAALALVDEAEAHPCGRLSGMIAPGQVDTCLEETFRKAMAAAEARGIAMQTHAGQTVPEFHEMVRRTGRTP